MIKAQNLRIGNLVWISNPLLESTDGNIYKVTGINSKEDSSFPNSDSVISLEGLDFEKKYNQTYSQFSEFVKPVLIQDFILDKLGFDYLGKYGYGIGKFHIVNRVGKWGFPIAGEIRFLKYVHELQNLFFALTSNELVLSEA